MSTETLAAEAAKQPARERLIVQDNSAISYLMDTSRFEHCYRIAKLMATASLIPDHLRMDMKTKQLLPMEQVQGNCFMIVNQSLRWGFDPFAVAPETYIVGGKLAYQGKLVAAAVNALGGLVGGLEYEFSGKLGTDDFMITVSGQKVGEDKPRTVTVTVGQAKTDNQMWRKDPEQKLVYTGSVKWARRHTPGVIMGIIIQEDVEEMEMRDVTPREQTPTKVITGGQSEAAAEPVKKTTRGKAKAKDAEAAEAPAMPTRPEMYVAIKQACVDAQVSPQTAEAKFKEAKLLKGPLSETTDDELFAIYQARLTVLPPKAVEKKEKAPAEEPVTVQAVYENHTVQHSPEGADRKWTMSKLRYSVDGDKEPREAVSFSSTIGDFLDTLEGGENLSLTTVASDKGDTIKSVALVTEGGDK